MKITKVEPILLSYEYKPDEQWGWSGGEVKVWHTSFFKHIIFCFISDRNAGN